MQLFSTDTISFFKYFFGNENMKKQPSKVAHNRPKRFFQYCQPAQNQPDLNLCSIKITHLVTYV
jgi:hypothetical protein